VGAVKNSKNVVDVSFYNKEDKMKDLNVAIKKSFGEKLKVSRLAAGYSRAKLAAELGISAKTIQSWETGRTFPENMSLIPIIESRLGFFIPDMLSETVREETGSGSQKVAPQEDTAQASPEMTEKTNSEGISAEM
jgi:transcriptional regulator with XRE-family HTH domain